MLLTLVGLAMASSLAFPAAAMGQVPTGDSAFGSGHALATSFSGSIQAGPSGENPTGSLTTSGFLNFTATATCLNVSGNAAVIGFRIDTGPQAGQGFLVSIVDNGPPVGGQPVDTVVYSGLLPTPPATCPAPGDAPPPGFSSTGGGPLTSGDLTVIDALPLPTSKDQCTRGGWRQFGFRNQGECVAFVQRGPRPTPGAADGV